MMSSTGFVPQMLYMCALDAQAQGRKELGFTVLKQIIRQYDEAWMSDEAKQDIRLPVLLRCSDPAINLNRRCIIRFTYAEMDHGKTADPAIITVLCSHFEIGFTRESQEMNCSCEEGRGIQSECKEH